MPKQKRRPQPRGRKRKNRKRRRTVYLCSVYLMFALVVFGLIYMALYKYVHKVDEKRICDNIYIGPVKVSGMDAGEAKSAMEQKAEEWKNLKLTMGVGDQTAEATLGELGFSMKEVDKLVKEAVSYGKEGSLLERFKAIRRLKKEKKQIILAFSLDKEAASSVIDERTTPLEKRAVNAAITHDSSGFQITEESAGQSVDIENAIQKIEKHLNGKWKYTEIKMKLPEIAEEPHIKKADLETIQEELGSYQTEAGYGKRVTNLKRGAELLNGRVLMPGEELSVLDATMPYSEENGYVDGGAYENGEVVQSIAGGICQVSTTLYNAVLYSELEVTERSAHSIIVSYVDPSRDAAVAEGVKDFKFKNSYDTPILIEGYIDGNNMLRFYIYGKDTRAEGHSVEFESETLEKKEYTKKYIEDSEKELGYMESEGTPINGRTARLWKVVYENGEEVSRDVINNSTYNPTEIKIRVGTASDITEASELVRNAIKSQDEGQIKEAISQARMMKKKEEE